MKIAMDFENTEEWIAGIIGMIVGCLAYMNSPGFLQIDWSYIAENAARWAWAFFVSISTGAGAYIGNQLIKKYWTNRKRKKDVGPVK